jgi:UDP-N-acetylglucosamine 1-carboxyvinyltransferase
VISGPTPLKAAEITVPDLRGGFSHLIAALAAEGTSTVHGIGIIDRGYEDFRNKLTALGAAIE